MTVTKLCLRHQNCTHSNNDNHFLITLLKFETDDIFNLLFQFLIA